MKKDEIKYLLLIVGFLLIILVPLGMMIYFKEKFVIDVYKTKPDDAKLKDFKPNPKKVTKLKTMCDETFDKCIKW